MTDNESILSGGEYTFCYGTRKMCYACIATFDDANQRAAKRDGIRIEQELACLIIATRKLPVADPVDSDI